MSFIGQFDTLHEQAIDAAGDLTDFGDKAYQKPLRLLLNNYDHSGHFSELGNQFVSGAVISNLVARLVREQGLRDYPQYANASVARPIIIIGMTRTGTTMLHRLIGLDPALQTLPLWLSSLPMPRPPRDTWETNPAFKKIEQTYEQMYAITPMMQQMHPQSAAEADECRIALDHSFWSPGAMGTSYCSVPEYLDWCLNGDAHYAYREYKTTLGLIAGGDNSRWLLKDPCHIFALDALIEAFPDACLVFTHRDPVDSFLSFGNLISHSRKLAQSTTDLGQIVQSLADAWGPALVKTERIRTQIPASQTIDLYFKDVISDPVGAVKRIYEHFDLDISEEASSLWQQQVESDPSGGHEGGGKEFSLKDFDLSEQDIYSFVGGYYDRFICVLDQAVHR